MKNVKALLIPACLFILVVGFFSFTNYEEDKKCKIKIVKIVDGVETVIDSTFDCDENMNMTWMSSLHNMGDSMHKVMKSIVIDGDSGSFNFDFDINTTDENGVKIMKINAGDGKEVEMMFDVEMTDDENGKMKMMINGEEMEIDVKSMHEHMDKFHEHMGDHHQEMSENVEIIIEEEEDGKEKHSIQIIKKVDDNGDVTIKKIVNGVEEEMSEEDLKDMHHNHKMMFIGKEDDDIHKNISIDVKVDAKDEKGKRVVIIKKMTSDKKNSKRITKEDKKIDPNELSVEELSYSPNPNNGKFDLRFKLNKKKPVEVKIFDIQGKVIYQEMVDDFSGEYSNSIDISENGEGIYIMRIIQNKKSLTNKIIIQ
jgi:hypothetical protein